MKTIPLFFFLTISVGLNAQNNWNFIQPLPFFKLELTDIIVDNDAIIVYGDGFNNPIDQKQGLIVAKIDTNGNIINTNFISDSLGDAITVSVNWGKITKSAFGGYAATAAPYISNSAYLIKLNNNLEVEFIKEYPDSINLSNFDYKIKALPSGYLLYGSIQLPDYLTQGFVKYVDSTGSIIWERFYSFVPKGTYVQDLDLVNDSLFVFSTTEVLIEHTNFVIGDGRAGIYLLNIQGNIVGSWQSGPSPEIGYMRKVIALPDTTIVTFGAAPKQIVFNTLLAQPTIAGFNGSLTKLWHKNIGNIGVVGDYNSFHRFSKTIDGNIAGFGGIVVESENDDARGHGWVYKFSPQGDSIWGRNFHPPFPDVYPNGGILYGGGILSSGSLVGGGMATDGQSNFCWIVKLTNDGCMDTLFCQTSPVRQPEEPAVGIRIYPNPARGAFQIDSPVAIVKVTLFDASGKLVLEKIEKARHFSIQLPGNIAGGLYFVRMQTEDGAVVSKKVWVESL